MGSRYNPAALMQTAAQAGMIDRSGRLRLPGSERQPWDEQAAVVPSMYSEPGMATPLDSAAAGGGPLKSKPPRLGDGGSGSTVSPPRLERAKRPNFEKELAKLSEPPRRNVLRSVLEALPAAAAYANGNYELGARLSAANMGRSKDQSDLARENQMQSLKWRMGEYERQHAADLKAADPVTIGRNMVRLDPRTNQATTVFKAPAEFEEYAAAQGLERGSPPYNTALQDYVLRSNGPTAHGFDVDLDNVRTGNRVRLEDNQQNNRVGLEGIRHNNRMTLRRTPPPPRLGGAGRENLPTVNSPAEAMKLPPGTKFRTTDGRIKIRP